MCGIAGEVSFSPVGVDPTFVRSACVKLLHRGPDEEGWFQSPKAILAIRRLKIIGLDGGAQPAYTLDRKIVCVLNGEIYNHRDLRRKLESMGRPPLGSSDAHIVPMLYEAFGLDFINSLHGMFSIALYDERRHELLLFTDRFGKKPLFYSVLGNGNVVFASELNALMANSAISREIDLEAVDQYLSYRIVPGPHTVYRSVRKVSPGNVLTFRVNQPQENRQYFEVAELPPLPIESTQEAVEALRSALDSAVEDRLEAEVPLGAMLSGGLDSSLIVAIASRKMTKPLQTFSIGFSDKEFDETRYANIVSAFCGTDHSNYQVEPDDAAVAADLVLKHMGEPYGFPSAIASFYMFRLASKRVTVTLTGDGADELFCGYNRYKVLNRFPDVFESDRHRVDLEMWKTGHHDLANRYQAVLIDGLRNHQKVALYSRQFKDKLSNAIGFNYLSSRFNQINSAAHPVEQAMAVDRSFWLPDAQLVKIDRMAMAHGIEPRSPMLDHRVVKLATSLDFQLKLKCDEEKFILKEVAANYLPDAIVRRRKQELAVPLENWLATHLRTHIAKTLLSEQSLERGYFLPDVLRELVSANRRQDSYALWTLFMLERWHSQFENRDPLCWEDDCCMND